MIELYHAAFSGPNIVYTVLLLLVLLYWCIVMLGVVDFDFLNLDFDLDIDVDGDFDLDGPSDSGGGSFIWLSYFNMGEVPILMYGSIVVLAMWIVSVQMNEWIDSSPSDWVQANRNLIAAGMALPNFLFGMHVAKFLMLPIRRLKRVHKVVVDHDGKMCLVRSLEVDGKYGQVEIATEDSPLLLNARTENGEKLVKGDAATVVRHVSTEEDTYFIVTKAKN